METGCDHRNTFLTRRRRPAHEANIMQLKDIVSTLMLSDLYFSLPLWERQQVVARLSARLGPKPPSGPPNDLPLRTALGLCAVVEKIP